GVGGVELRVALPAFKPFRFDALGVVAFIVGTILFRTIAVAKGIASGDGHFLQFVFLRHGGWRTLRVNLRFYNEAAKSCTKIDEQPCGNSPSLVRPQA